MASPDVNDILKKYGRKIDSQIATSRIENVNYSREYSEFKKEMMPSLSRYERLCHSLGNIVRIKVSKKDEDKIKRALDIAHLDVDPGQALTLSMMTFLFVTFIGIMILVGFYLITGTMQNFMLLFFFMIVVCGLFLFYFTKNYPLRLANKWRLKASSQMVPAVLYVVVYMRHTSNLERAIEFTSEHLQPPLALDFKKVFYDVEVGRFSTIKESLDHYLETWREYNTEFIEAFHLIESSLYEPNESQRIQILEKSLQVILEGVYDKMLKFTHDVRSPLTNVYMLGVVLPTLGLALLPLASTMLQGLIQWYHVFILFNLLIPFVVFYLTDNIMLNRPGGYGETQLLEMNPLYPEYKKKKHYLKGFLIAFPFILIGLLPMIFQYTPIPGWFNIPKDFTFQELGISLFGTAKFFDFQGFGPLGIGALMLSLFIPLGVGLFFVTSFSSKTKDLIKERENTRQLENEFNSSLFQLGNRLGSGIPAELVFGKIAESARGLRTEDFFRRVNYNIQQNGMSVDEAIFNTRRGAIIYYPSELIATSMKILVESVKKGLKIAAVSLMSISEYVKNIQKINERLNDLLAEIVSEMKSNMTFLAPLLSGVVVGLAGMITVILLKLQSFAQIGSGENAGFGNLQTILQIFDPTQMIPTYFLQIAIGIYLVQIIFILTNTLVTIDSGEDELQRLNRTGKNIRSGMLLYFIVSLISILALSLLSSVVIQGLG